MRCLRSAGGCCSTDWICLTAVACCDSCNLCDKLVCHSGTLVTVSHQTMLEPHCCCLQSAVGPIWFVDSCDSCVVTIHQTMLWPKPRAGQASKWKYFRCEFCKGAMSTTRQDGPSTGLVAAAVLFVAFAAKDLFSETTPGEDWDHTRWRLRSHQVEILMLFCLSCRSWFPRWSDWHKCGERSQWCNWWRGNCFFLTTDGEVVLSHFTTDGEVFFYFNNWNKLLSRKSCLIVLFPGCLSLLLLLRIQQGLCQLSTALKNRLTFFLPCSFLPQVFAK